MASLREIQAAMSGFPRNLTWNDFRRVSDSLSPPAEASTGAQFSTTRWSVKMVDGEYRVHGAHVNVSINSNDTWAVPSARTNANLLRHEQGHYDITGLIARDLIRKILDLSLDAVVIGAMQSAGDTPQQHRNFALERLQSYIDTYVQEANELGSKLQTNPVTGADGIYDVQTNHSQNTNGQAVWNARLQRMKAADENFALTLAIEGIVT